MIVWYRIRLRMASQLGRDAAEAITTLFLHDPLGLGVRTIEVHAIWTPSSTGAARAALVSARTARGPGPVADRPSQLVEVSAGARSMLHGPVPSCVINSAAPIIDRFFANIASWT